MTNTTNYGLRKPEKQDPVDIADLNYNADAIDAAMHENRTTRADLTLSNLSQPQKAIINLGAEPRQNIVDNAYFVGGGSGWGVFPINQKGKQNYSGDYQTAISRWTMYDSANVVLSDKGLSVTGTLAQLVQKSTFDDLAGKIVTISSILADGSYGSGTGVVSGPGQDTFIQANIGSGFVSVASFNEVFSYQIARINNLSDVVAVKVEEGPDQTLYYVGSDGKAVLIPQKLDYASELLKCQSYYQLYTSPESRPNSPDDCRPVMRKPDGGKLTQGTIEIDGSTYYYNSAEL